MIDKVELVSKLIRTTEEELERAMSYQKDSQEDANVAEGAMVSRYDTFKEEAQYLSDAQKIRVIKLESGLADLIRFKNDEAFVEEKDRVGLGALVVTEEETETTCYFIAPFAGGNKYTVSGVEVSIITPEAPIGRALMGREQDDEVKVNFGGGKREIYIESIV